MLARRKDSFIEEGRNPGEKVDSCPKELTSIVDRGARVFKGDFQGCTGRTRGLHAEQHSQL